MSGWKSAIPLIAAATIGIAAAWTPMTLGSGRLHVTPIPTADLPINLSEPLLTPAMIRARGVDTLGAMNYLLAGAGLIATFCTLVLLAVARAAERRTEILVHRAVGASRTHLLRRGLHEGLLMAGIAMAIGAALGMLALQYARGQWPGTISVTNALVPLAIATGVATVILLGVVVPLLSVGKMRPQLPPLAPILAPAICAIQLAVCFAVLVQSRQILREGTSLTREAPGHGGDGRLVQLQIPGPPAERARQLAELIRRTGLSDLFDMASLSSPGTLEGIGTANIAVTECGNCFEGGIGTPLRPVAIALNVVSADTFRAMNAHLIEGRWIADTDDRQARRVAVISQALARAHFENGQAMGRAIQLGQSRNNRFIVIGVVDDPDAHGLGAALQPAYAVYTSVLQVAPSAVDLLLRPRGTIDWSRIAPIPAALVRSIIPETTWRAQAGAPVRWFGVALLVDAAFVALIALLGITTSVTMWISGMLQELAVRRSVGARRRDVLLHILGRCAAMAMVGLVLGVMLALLSADPLSAIVPGAQSIDIRSITEIAFLIVLATGAAVSIPAWRACVLRPIDRLIS
jgi:putative ABC transport system permease protein